jgi:carboxyl-terminal processing protease
VQTTRQLAYEAQLKITTAKYYIPSGRCIQALDYAHRHSDGSVTKFADSLKREFKTKVGRKVYDGAGLDPDLSIKTETISNLTVELASSGLIFDYASKYCGEHKQAPKSMHSFKLTDQDYEQFVAWVKTEHFVYSSELETKMESVIASAKDEKYFDQLQSSLSDLKLKIAQAHSNDFSQYKPELLKVLEQEIAFHYQLVQGQIDVSLETDGEILAAKKLLGDQPHYKQLLSPQ